MGKRCVMDKIPSFVSLVATNQKPIKKKRNTGFLHLRTGTLLGPFPNFLLFTTKIPSVVLGFIDFIDNFPTFFRALPTCRVFYHRILNKLGN